MEASEDKETMALAFSKKWEDMTAEERQKIINLMKKGDDEIARIKLSEWQAWAKKNFGASDRMTDEEVRNRIDRLIAGSTTIEDEDTKLDREHSPELMVNVVKATVLKRHADTCMVTLDLPSSTPKVDDSLLGITFVAERGTGVEYVKKHFGVEPEVVDLSMKPTNFSGKSKPPETVEDWEGLSKEDVVKESVALMDEIDGMIENIDKSAKWNDKHEDAWQQLVNGPETMDLGPLKNMIDLGWILVEKSGSERTNTLTVRGVTARTEYCGGIGHWTDEDPRKKADGQS